MFGGICLAFSEKQGEVEGRVRMVTGVLTSTSSLKPLHLAGQGCRRMPRYAAGAHLLSSVPYLLELVRNIGAAYTHTA